MIFLASESLAFVYLPIFAFVDLNSSVFYLCLLFFRSWNSLCSLLWLGQALWHTTVTMSPYTAGTVQLLFTFKFLPLLLRHDWLNSIVLLKHHPCHCHRVGEFYFFSCFLATSNKNLKFHENKGVCLLFFAQSTDATTHRVQQMASRLCYGPEATVLSRN